MGLFSKPVNNKWRWAGFGKHPAARDYFHVGAETPILKAFSNWVESGFERLDPDKKANTNFHSWRFWANGPEKDVLICGICKHSSDQIGRPYPFVVMGTGYLKQSQKYWGLLPFALDRLWIQMEHRASRRYARLNEMEDEIRKIQPPHSDWHIHASQRGEVKKFRLFAPDGNPYPNPVSIVKDMGKRSNFIAPLPDNREIAPLAQANHWHFFLQTHVKTIPNAVFIGGYQDKSFLAVFNRSLAPEDFKTLWSTSLKGTDRHG